MKKRVFLRQAPRKPEGGLFLAVTGPNARLKEGAAFEWLKKPYYVGKGGELRRLYK
jgi:hypothetical protein